MAKEQKINDQVTVAAQPSESEIRQLGQQGFKTVVNFRTDGEDDQPLPPDAEAAVVKQAGLEYLHVPVSMNSMGPDVVDRFREAYADLPKPVYAHCKSGKRAGAMVMMHMAVEQGMSGDQTLEQAKQMGFECDQPQLEKFVRQYVDSHTASA
ncbi:beta-lactamase hydrolase domain-containing protein [Roseimaritima sediminicola]|uniref:beta-lactamase hydrolase domain-containing protein n=1 Tax=Roseimaritima sediminicola TaxID=2662066 RepID=UPI0012983641|nr:protein tyrosine phosphatase family protein [Roseimaritima sediminicola]